jgi:hypothetical protein
VAGRFALGTPVSRQQKALMLQLGLAREGEVIDDVALQAYVELFYKPLTQQHISACLALFGWLPEVDPVVDEVDADVVV